MNQDQTQGNTGNHTPPPRRIRIHHHTRYRYEREVSFSPHAMRLFPRREPTLHVEAMRLQVRPSTEPSYRLDHFDNLTAYCFFPDRGRELHFDLMLDLAFHPKNPFGFLLAPHAWRTPFVYKPEELAALRPFIEHGGGGVLRPDFWSPPTSARPTIDVLVELNSAIFESIAYERRDEGAARSPEETLRLGSGACRDSSVLLAALLRQMGIASRLVSGYLCELDVDEDKRKSEGSMHAWTEAYIPGAGWLSMDPTNGIFTNENFIPVAAGLEPADIMPVAGSYYSDVPVPSEMEATLELSTRSDSAESFHSHSSAATGTDETSPSSHERGY